MVKRNIRLTGGKVSRDTARKYMFKYEGSKSDVQTTLLPWGKWSFMADKNDRKSRPVSFHSYFPHQKSVNRKGTWWLWVVKKWIERTVSKETCVVMKTLGRTPEAGKWSYSSGVWKFSGNEVGINSQTNWCGRPRLPGPIWDIMLEFYGSLLELNVGWRICDATRV